MSLIHQNQLMNFASEHDNDEFSLFANALKNLRVEDIDPLDPEHGPAAMWKKICDSKLDSRNIHLTPEQKESWSLERNTWQLVQMLYTERTAPPQSSSKLVSNPYLPPLKVVNLHLSKSKDLLELSTFRDWLYTCPSSTHPAEIRRGYWPYTKASLKHALQKYPQSDSRRNTAGKAPPFHSMDPDAPLRASSQQTSLRPQTLQAGDTVSFVSDPNTIQEKGELEQLDQEYDRAMVKTLFEYVRAGEMGLALDFCRQCDHPWRAASLAGGQLFHDPPLADFENESPFPEDEVLPDAESLDAALNGSRNLPPYNEVNRSGCLNRKLWKSMCLHMSSNKSLPTYEQALYGALAGEISSVLPVCYTWEDHVWCHINSIFEHQVDRILESNQLGYYWTHGALPPSNNNEQDASDDELITASLQPRNTDRQIIPQRSNEESQPDIKNAMNKAFDKILRSEQTSLAESARNPFHVAQMWLAIDKINDLFTSFADRLRTASEDFTREHLSHLLRFFSHLILFLRSINEKVDSEASNAILRGYVQVLEMENKHNLIAFYVAELQPESGVETYAKYLISLGPSADLPTRRVALLRALEHGLDLSRVACTAVKLTLQEITRTSVESNREHGLNKFSHQLTDKQRVLIRSLEWLIIDPVTYPEALIQANSLIRYFLTAGHPNAAREVVGSIPADVLSVIAQGKDPLAEPEEGDMMGNTHNAILEFTQYRDFFSCLELHVQVNEILSQRPMTGATSSDLEAFTQALEEMCDHLHAAVVGILSSEWLQDLHFNPTENIEEEQEQTSDCRLAELSLIRNIYIPELVFRLHGALAESGTYIVTNLRRALDLATLVANESYKNYAEFLPPSNDQNLTGITHKNTNQNKMKDYLRELRVVHLLILKSSGVHPLRPVLK
ncbi:hypothetical protein MJO29_004858 [Puccinia striiformis f. sp. tritici]|uniref:Nuclear pore complex protein n=1 Tax=Puccinia striiformis f. sp. tritici PST-78 TaxID=1165861 RepID=A0A0L0VMQ7_9BASI|nr:hypothetical protein Pst134EA_009001 [Puccinia striiformis f. sp. tritici]KAI9609595.1 hypothetical protein H4Q26_007555 [Puccinia striiformis f. sp. tritici PST-130]KNF00536.1 hypothetical protein PSTG_06228 [Puccinia striiformis f. sp. tritici PST-78]KAH9457702.1 hypothetical protein Pst134EB_033388 [Puccinia striiformis f. sp. tritici]KAH9468457.1 hypothetical protein Pst134EA_009001 [Puccinia striiformis f. sp. tritici]KAI7959790.1 hypothetical protein MJO29_004858 [Puccinia striiformis